MQQERLLDLVGACDTLVAIGYINTFGVSFVVFVGRLGLEPSARCRDTIDRASCPEWHITRKSSASDGQRWPYTLSRVPVGSC